MSTFGLLPTGLSIPTLQDIVADINVSLRASLAASLNLTARSVLGQIVMAFAEQVSILWQTLLRLYAAQDPDAAMGALLDALGALTGAIRIAARASTVTLTLCGVPGTLVAAGNTSQAGSTSTLWTHLVDGTIATLTPWAALTTYAADDRVTRASRAYQCVTPGTSASSGGPSTTDPDITDGTVHWEYIGEGMGAVDVAAACSSTGPTFAAALDIDQPFTFVNGWQSVRNLADAEIGADVETDEDFRVRRSLELSSPGTSPPDAIRADILAVAGVTACTVYFNPTDSTDGNGLPPHSVMCLVQGGSDADVADGIFASVAAGIDYYGGGSPTTVNVTDSMGNVHPVSFARPNVVVLYVDITLIKYPGPGGSAPSIIPAYPTDGDTEVQSNIATYGQAQPVSRDAVGAALATQAFKVDGVLDVPQVLIWTAAIATSPAAWTGTHAYSTGDQVVNDGRQYVCTTGGTSASSGGPSTTGTAITDGGAVWRWMGATYAIDSFSQMGLDSGRIAVHSSNGTP